MSELPRGTVTLLFTDVEGSTQLQHRLGEQYQAVVAQHRRLLEDAFAKHGGVVVDRQTESFFVAFPRAREAVAAAADAQRAVTGHAWPDGENVRVRMGLHSGDPEVNGDRYVGLAVARAARICACAHGGQVLLSSSARALLSDHERAGLRTLGRYQLKDFTEPEPISQLVVDGLPSEFPPLRTEAAPSRRRWLLLAVGAAALAGTAGVLVLALTSGGSSGGLSGLAPGSVGRIDPSRATLVQQFQVGGSPTEVAVGGGAVWTANETDRTVTRVDVPSGQESSVAVGAHPDSIAIGADAVWAGCRIEGTVLRIDPQLLEVTQRVRVSKRGSAASAPSGLAVGAGSVWTVFGALTLTRIAAGAGRPVASLTPDAGSNAVTYRTGGVWVGGEGAATEVDPATNEASTQVTQLPGNTVAIGADARWVWAVTEFPSKLVQIDPASSTVANTLTLDDGAAGVAIGGGWVWVSNPLTRTVERVDPKTMKVTATIAIGARPTGIAYGEGSVWISGA